MLESSANLAGAITFVPTTCVQTIYKNRGVDSSDNLAGAETFLPTTFHPTANGQQR
jgi:hypothetical protein